MSISKHLSGLQIRGIKKAGDILFPGSGPIDPPGMSTASLGKMEGELELKLDAPVLNKADHFIPKFSQSHVIYEIDRILDYMTVQDLSDFKFLSMLMGITPVFILRLLLETTNASTRFRSIVSAPFRQIQLGVKGVIMTLSYSDVAGDGVTHRAIGWDAQRPRPASSPVLSTVGQAYRDLKTGSDLLRKLTVKERLVYLSRLKAIVLKRQDWVAQQIVEQTQKSATDALVSEVFGVLDHLQYLEKFSGGVLADQKVYTPLVLLGKKSQIFFEPLGTILVISPWNYPFYQALVPITSALVCGNTVMYKPSEVTPMRGVVEELLAQAGVPSNWVKVMYGDGQLGKELIDGKPSKIFFTGSVATGSKIMAQAAVDLIPVELELGGKDPMIVFEGTDIKRAAAGALWGACTNSGQSCTSVERLYVQESIYPEFRQELLRQLQALDLNSIGPMTSLAQAKIVREQLRDALEKGAVAIESAQADRFNASEQMIFPVVLEGTNSSMKIHTQETFGPLIPLHSFKTEEEVIGLANDSEYGLSASVWSKDIDQAIRVARRIETGNVSINNVMVSEGNHALPFGGVKKSGFGRYKGAFGLYSFSNIKSIIAESSVKKMEAHWYPYTDTKYGLFRRLMKSVFGGGLGLLRLIVVGLRLEMHTAQVTKGVSNSKKDSKEGD